MDGRRNWVFLDGMRAGLVPCKVGEDRFCWSCRSVGGGLAAAVWDKLVVAEASRPRLLSPQKSSNTQCNYQIGGVLCFSFPFLKEEDHTGASHRTLDQRGGFLFSFPQPGEEPSRMFIGK